MAKAEQGGGWLKMPENPSTRLEAASQILGRRVDENDASAMQYLIGIAEPEERLANLLMQRASEVEAAKKKIGKPLTA